MQTICFRILTVILQWVFLLKLYGAKIEGVVLKPKVNIKFPWNLIVSENVWIGENVWIDNLDKVIIGDNVCISQGAFLINWKS